MKTNNLTKLAIFILLAIFSSCTKEEIFKNENSFKNKFDSNTKEISSYGSVVIDKEFGKYTKELTIYDAKKENSAVILVGSDDDSILKLWGSENFSLLPRMRGETLAEVADKYFATKDDAVEKSNAELSNFVAEISTMFISKKLGKGVGNVILLTHEPSEYVTKGWWSYGTHYSDHYGLGETGSMTCFVYGYNWYNRGWWGLKFKKSSNHSWTTVVSEWKQIKSGDNDDRTREGYKMRARRKYRNNSVLIEFDD